MLMEKPTLKFSSFRFKRSLAIENNARELLF
jgi:hypothetical protein